MRLILEILAFIVLAGVLPVVINKSTEIHLDWVRRYLREIWLVLFAFFFVYWMAKPEAMEAIMNLHKRWPGSSGYLVCALFGIIVFCGFWWFTGLIAGARRPNTSAPSQIGVTVYLAEILVGEDVTNSFGKILVTADVSNTGEPTALDGWQLEITIPDEPKPLIVSPMFIDPDKPVVAGNIKWDSSDALYNKTKPAPVPTGTKIPGILIFDVHGRTQPQLNKIGTKFILICNDIHGNVIRSSPLVLPAEWTVHKYIPGLKPPPK
jgi:hypothetical protein